MGVQVGALFVDIATNSAAFASDMGKASNSVRSWGSNVNKYLGGAERAFQDIGRSVKRSVADMLSFKNVLGAIVGTGVLGYLTKGSLDHAAAIGEQSYQLGLSTKAFQEYTFAAKMAGVDQQNFVSSTQKFLKNLGDIRAGAGGAATSIGQLNPALLSSLRSAKSTEEALDVTFKTLGNMSDAAERATLGTALFGKQWGALSEIIRKGESDLKAAREEANKLGIVMSDDMIKAADEASDKMDKLGIIFKSRLTTAIVENAASIDKLVGSLIDLTPTLISVVGVITKAISIVFKLAGGIFNLAKSFVTLDEQLYRHAIKPFVEMEIRILKTMRALSKFKDSFGLGGAIDTKTYDDAIKLAETRVKDLKNTVEDIKSEPTTPPGFGTELDYAAHNKLAQASAKKEADAVETIFKRSTERITDSFSDSFYNVFRSGKIDAKSWADSLKDIFARTLSEMATMALAKPIILPIISQVGGMFGFGGGGGGVASGGGGGSIFGNISMLSGLKNIKDMFSGTGSIMSSLNTPFFGNTSLANFTPLSGIAGLGGGMLANLLLGGNRGAGSSIGGLAGGVAGTFLGGPIGAAIGSFAGNALGGLFGGGKPSDKTQTGKVNLAGGTVFGQTGLTGSKFSQANVDAVNAIAKYAQDIGQTLGGLNTQLEIIVGNREGIRFALDGGEQINAGKDINEALAKLEEIILSSPQAIKKQQDQVKKNFADSVKDRILAITDPNKLKLQQLDIEFAEIRKQAISLGMDLADIEKVYGLERINILKETQDNAIDIMRENAKRAKALIDNIMIDSGLSGLSPENRYREAQRQAAAAKAGFQSGDATFDDVERSIRNLLEASNQYWSFTEPYFKDQGESISFLKSIENAAGISKDNDSLMLDLSKQQTDLLSGIFDKISASLILANKVSDDKLLKKGEDASFLDTLTPWGITQRLDRQLKFTAGYNPNTATDIFRNTAGVDKDLFKSLLKAVGGDVSMLGFASGGRTVADGLILTGENGPEIMNAKSGSTILNTRQTLESMAGGSGSGLDQIAEDLYYSRMQQSAVNMELTTEIKKQTAAIDRLARIINAEYMRP